MLAGNAAEFKEKIEFFASTFVNIMCADVHRHDQIAFDVKNRAQIAFNIHGVDGLPILGGKAVNFVRTQARVKRVLLEDFPCAPRGIFLAGT